MATNLVINNNTPRAPYVVSAAQSSFDVPFAFFEDTDLVVLKTVGSVVSTLLLGTDYSVRNAGESVGGVVDLAVAVSNCQITIYRDVPTERTTDFPLTGPFPIGELNEQLDRLVAMAQQNKDLALRSIHMRPDDPYVGFELPPPESRANKALIFDSSGGVALSTDDFNTVVARAEQAVTDAQNIVNGLDDDIAALNALLVQAQQLDVLPAGGSAGQPVVSDGSGGFVFGSLLAARDLSDVQNSDFLAKAVAAGVNVSTSSVHMNEALHGGSY